MHFCQKLHLKAAAVLVAVSLLGAAVANDATLGRDQHVEVRSLPGWTGPLPSKIFSGFGYAGVPPGFPNGSMHMHYIWVESERAPRQDPTIVWYNGGPGADSMFGMLVELGPLLLNDNSMTGSGGVPRLLRNPFSWSKVANLLFVNSPPPVGFSYCLPIGPTGNGTSCGPWNDTSVAQANHLFLTRLFAGALQAHQHLPLYVMGESYAGVYVTTIVRELLAEPRGIDLAGFAVGDGCLGTHVLCGQPMQHYYYIEFLHGHGQVSERLYNQVRSTCPEEQLRSGQLVAPHCQDLVTRMFADVGTYYPYGLYDECYWRPGGAGISQQLMERRRWTRAMSPAALRLGLPTAGAGGGAATAADAVTDYPCPGQAMNIWLALPEVRAALKVPADSNWFSGDNGEGFNYTLSETDVRPIHYHAATSTQLRVLVYNGDTDPGINSFITQDKLTTYLEERGVRLVSEWRPWTLDGRRKLVGYVMQYEGNWTFATVRGAAHMVPETKPAAALALISAFLASESLPPLSLQ